MSTHAGHPYGAAISALKVNTNVTGMADVESQGIKTMLIHAINKFVVKL